MKIKIVTMDNKELEYELENISVNNKSLFINFKDETVTFLKEDFKSGSSYLYRIECTNYKSIEVI